jgi:cell wall-associated NlpC family hydrolase
MQRIAVGLLLDEGAREVAGVVCALVVVVVVLAVFQAVAAPAILLIGPAGSVSYASVTERRDSPTTPLASPPLAPAPAARSRSVAGSRLVETARHYLGVKYVFGGVNPATGLDCSGLAQLVYRQVGLSLPRTAQQQYDATPRVSPEELQPGDLVFFARTYAEA